MHRVNSYNVQTRHDQGEFFIDDDGPAFGLAARGPPSVRPLPFTGPIPRASFLRVSTSV